MSYNSRRILTPGASRKRKEMEALVSSTSSKPPTAVTRAVSFTTSSKGAEQQQPLAAPNRLLAGYMAYEFLTQGTLFGQKLEPEDKRNKPSQAEPTGKSKPKPQGYAEVANLMKSNRAHIHGIINPTQLARWIQM